MLGWWFSLGHLEVRKTKHDINKGGDPGGQSRVTRAFGALSSCHWFTYGTWYNCYICVQIYLHRKEIMKHILFLWPGRDVLEFFFAKSEKLMTSAITIYPYHNLKASLSTTIGPGTFQPPGSKLREFAAEGFWLSDLFWNICPDWFSQIWVEVEGNPIKHQCSYKKAPLDRWLNSYCTRHRCSDGCFIFPGMSINAAPCLMNWEWTS